MSTGSASVVDLASLKVGRLVAEGGEGRVFELVDERSRLLKVYRRNVEPAVLESLVSWPAQLERGEGHLKQRAGRLEQGAGRLEQHAGRLEQGAVEHLAEMAARIRTHAAWPSAVVTAASDGRAVGVLMDRAPRRYSLVHNDHSHHLANLSYLTADPESRSLAYGLSLPPPFSRQRLGIVLALASIIEAMEAGGATHGDLSARNILWSLERGPEVYILDCDSAEVLGSSEGTERRRAMTPNWDDPAIPRGSNPSPLSDRYSLAVAFLRISAAAHFPIQARQRAEKSISLEIDVPPRQLASPALAPGAQVWELLARGLSADDPGGRPSAGEWAVVLSEMLGESAGHRGLALHRRGAGDRGRPVAHDVTIQVVPARRRQRPERYTTLTPPAATGGPAMQSPLSQPPLSQSALSQSPATQTPSRAGGTPAGAQGAQVGTWRGAPNNPGVPMGLGPHRSLNRDTIRAVLAVIRDLILALADYHWQAIGEIRRGKRFTGTLRLGSALSLDLLIVVLVGFGLAVILDPIFRV